MAYTLEAFAKDAQEILSRDPGPAGREQIARKLEALLAEDSFIQKYCEGDVPKGRTVLYEDPKLGFQILRHAMATDHVGVPHDHGASWAVYGQAVKHTDMTVWKRLDDGKEPGKAKIEKDKSYRLTRGKAGVYNGADIHSIAYPAGAIFIRVTGTDLEKVERLRYDPEKGTVVAERRASMRNEAA
jgi:hypothetical protein